jgi:hypothetical protein
VTTTASSVTVTLANRGGDKNYNHASPATFELHTETESESEIFAKSLDQATVVRRSAGEDDG